MAPNMALLAFTPEPAQLVTETAAKSSRLHRLYDFIVETQRRRAEREVTRYREATGRADAPRP